MNLLLLEKADFTDAAGHVVVTGRRFEHLRDVIHAEPGKRCKAGVLNGAVGHALLEAVEPERMLLRFEAEHEPPPPLPVILVAALPRPKSFTKVLHAAVSMGVKEIFFIGSFKVEKSYWSAPRLGAEPVREELLLALEQSGDTVLPQVEFRRNFKPFVEDELPGLLERRHGYLGDPYAAERLKPVAGAASLLVLGPEGGFTEYENARLREAGLHGVSLGSRTLRSEFALAALLGRF